MKEIGFTRLLFGREVVALTLIILIYVVFIGLYCLMSGCGVLNFVKRILAIFTSKLVRAILQIISYTVIGLTYMICCLGVLYLIYSSYYAYQWFSSTRYPSNCFSPSQLKTYLNRIKTSDKLCRIKVCHTPDFAAVSGREQCPPWRKTLSKDFAPHLWTETCELIDVSGMRPNRIESAYGLSDILEEFLTEKKVFLLDMGIDLEPEDTQSLRNTNKFVSKVLETASTLFESTDKASFCVTIPALRLKLQMRGPRLTAIIHRELDLPAFWYFVWKYRSFLMGVSTVLPIVGLFFQHLLEDVWQRHNLDIVHKYSFVPQTDPPYQFDKSIPDDPYIDFAEPQKITILLPSERFLLPRDSLGKIITGQMDLRQSRPLHRVSSTESSPPILTPHTSRMGHLLERAEEYRRSRGSTSSEGEKLSPPPSYTAVFDKEVEGLTPPPDYSRARAREGGSSIGDQSPHFFHEA